MWRGDTGRHPHPHGRRRQLLPLLTTKQAADAGQGSPARPDRQRRLPAPSTAQSTGNPDEQEAAASMSGVQMSALPPRSPDLMSKSLLLSTDSIPLFPEDDEHTHEYIKEMMVNDHVERELVMSPFLFGETNRRRIRRQLRAAERAQKSAMQESTTKPVKKDLNEIDPIDTVFLHKRATTFTDFSKGM